MLHKVANFLSYRTYVAVRKTLVFALFWVFENINFRLFSVEIRPVFTKLVSGILLFYMGFCKSYRYGPHLIFTRTMG